VAEKLETEIQRLGKRLLRGLFILYKMSGQYAKGHPALKIPAQEVLQAVREFDRWRAEPSILFHNDHLFSGDLRLKPDAAGFESFYGVMRLMRTLGIGSMVFDPSLDPQEPERWVFLVREIEVMDGIHPFETLGEQMSERGIHGIEILPLPSPEEMLDVGGHDQKERAKAVYMRTMGVVSEILDDVKIGRTLRIRRMKRVVQSVLDSLLTAETYLLGLTTIHSHDEYTYNHSVNVAILSMAIGQRVGLSKPQLVDLGIAGLFHDIGKADIPLEILNKPGAFTEDEWAIMKRHPIFGVKELLRLKGIDSLMAHAICGVFEHHRMVDGSGYPAAPYDRPASLFGRIVAIADCYDALTSSRVYRRVAEPPEAVLRFMIERCGKQFDAALMKLFVNAIGVFPLGTLCLLDSQEMAVVMQCHPDAQYWDRPVVRIIADASGQEMDGGLLDLADPHHHRYIAATLDARHYGIEVARYFV